MLKIIDLRPKTRVPSRQFKDIPDNAVFSASVTKADGETESIIAIKLGLSIMVVLRDPPYLVEVFPDIEFSFYSELEAELRIIRQIKTVSDDEDEPLDE